MYYEGSLEFMLTPMSCLNAEVYGRTGALREDDSHLHGDSEGYSLRAALNPLEVPCIVLSILLFSVLITLSVIFCKQMNLCSLLGSHSLTTN
jgi:hypothetical protein